MVVGVPFRRQPPTTTQHPQDLLLPPPAADKRGVARSRASCSNAVVVDAHHRPESFGRLQQQ